MIRKVVLSSLAGIILFVAICPLSVCRAVGEQEKIVKGKYGTYLDENGVWHETDKQKDQRMAWWREARFGMFIHWGLYSVAAGQWKGKQDKGLGEWIQLHYKIPADEYAKLAEKFDPVKYDPNEWVRLAKDAGMKYIVITSKHHDGFAMYDSKASNFNIVDSTPYGKDVIAALAKACQKQGIKLGFYYSQSQDWHEPDALMNYWDFKENIDKSPEKFHTSRKSKSRSWIRTTFPNYMARKGLPQIREILTQYGPICVIWYDTPRSITKEQSEAFVNAVRKLQPDCLISSRVGHGLGDYGSTGDNSIPGTLRIGDWETPATMNNTWGYKDNDTDWKSTKDIVHNLVDICSKGGNYLLNVGPTAEGVIPEASVKVLKEVGQWMDKNSDSIYGTSNSPFGNFKWGRCTINDGKVYLHVWDWPKNGVIEVERFNNKVEKAYFLENKQQLKFGRNKDGVVTVNVGDKMINELDTVVVLEIDGHIDSASFAFTVEQDKNGTIKLLAAGATVKGQTAKFISRGDDGSIEHWTDPDDFVAWDIDVTKPGKFDVTVSYACKSARTGQYTISVGDNKIDFETKDTGNWDTFSTVKGGQITLGEKGKYKLAVKQNSEKSQAINLKSVTLKPAKK